MRIAVALLLLLLVVQPSSAREGADGDTLCHRPDTSEAVARERAFDFLFLEALSLRDQERYDEAFDLFEHCLSLQPGSAVVSYELCAVYAYLGRKEEALAMMQRAAEGDPGNFYYRSMLAMTYEEEGLNDKAIETYEAMARDFSSESWVFAALASAYTDKGDYMRAVEALDNVERIEGRSENLTLRKYRLYMLMHNKEKALSELQGLIDEYPDDLSTQVFLGGTYLEFGDTLRALDLYNGVLAADSSNVLAQKSLADYYQRLGNDTLFTEAVERLLLNERFADEERGELVVRYMAYKEQTDGIEYNINLLRRLMQVPVNQSVTGEILARYMAMKKLPQDSINPVLEEILKYEPENSYAQMQLLFSAIKNEDYDEVILRCDTALLYNPEVLELYYFKGVSLYNRERPQEALEILERGLSIRTDNDAAEFVSDLFSLVGDIHHEFGSVQAAYLAYDTALVYNKDNIGVLNNYAYYLALDGRELEKALEMSHKTIVAEPQNITYIDTYMWVLFLLERYEEAKAYAEKLLALGNEADKDAVLYAHCGDIFAKCGDIQRAVEMWTKAREKGDTSKIIEKKIKRRKYIPDGKKKK